MDIIILSATALASAINSAMPGPCLALTIGRSARGGLNAGLSVTLGVISAKLVLVCVALSIMQGMVEVSETAFITMKGIGATALIFLALRMLSTRRKDTEGRSTSDGDQLRDASAGLAVGLSSPINLVFLLALLPQLVPGHGLDVAGTAGIIAAVLGGAAVSQLGAALIGAASGRIVRGAARHIECLGAVSMIGFAAVAMGAPIA